MYLIQALKYLDLSSDMIDLLIKSYECKELFYFLYDEENDSIQAQNNIYCKPQGQKAEGRCNRFEAFVPLTQEEARKKSFKDNDKVDLPAKGDYGEVTERFQFTQLNKKGKNIMYQCERIYLIDHYGQVVELISENIYPLQEADSEFSGLYTGILGEQFFHNNILKD